MQCPLIIKRFIEFDYIGVIYTRAFRIMGFKRTNLDMVVHLLILFVLFSYFPILISFVIKMTLVFIIYNHE